MFAEKGKLFFKMASLFDKVHCIYPIDKDDVSENNLEDEKKYFEQMECFIRCIKDGFEDLQEKDESDNSQDCLI